MKFRFDGMKTKKKIAIPSTAKRAAIRCLISVAIAAFSSAEYVTVSSFAFFAGEGSCLLVKRNIEREISIAATEAINE